MIIILPLIDLQPKIEQNCSKSGQAVPIDHPTLIYNDHLIALIIKQLNYYVAISQGWPTPLACPA